MRQFRLIYMFNETESAVFTFFLFGGGGGGGVGGLSLFWKDPFIPDNLEYVRRYLFGPVGPVGENDLNV